MYFIHSMYKELIMINYIINKERGEAPPIIIYYLINSEINMKE